MRTFKEYILEAVEDDLNNTSPGMWFRVKDIPIGTRSTGRDMLRETFRGFNASYVGKVLYLVPELEFDPSCNPHSDWWVKPDYKSSYEKFWHPDWLEPVEGQASEREGMNEAIEDYLENRSEEDASSLDPSVQTAIMRVKNVAIDSNARDRDGSNMTFYRERAPFIGHVSEFKRTNNATGEWWQDTRHLGLPWYHESWLEPVHVSERKRTDEAVEDNIGNESAAQAGTVRRYKVKKVPVGSSKTFEFNEGQSSFPVFFTRKYALNSGKVLDFTPTTELNSDVVIPEWWEPTQVAEGRGKGWYYHESWLELVE